MARGGARPGAGRPKGSVNKRTRELIHDALDRIEAAGEKHSIEVMYEVMRSYHRSWLESQSFEHAEKAAYWADKCAPYFHAKLSSVSIDTDEGDYEVTIKAHRRPASQED